MLKSVMTVGGWTMASRILGFVRDMLMAALIGTGPVADAFFVANKLPNLFRRLFGEGAFNAAFVPEFAGLLTAEGPAAARQFAQEAMAVMAFWLGALTILGEIFMPQIMTVFAPGFSADPAKFALAVDLARITFPYLMLICLAALLSGVLNGLDKFAAAAGAPVLYNLFAIAALVGLAPYVPTVGHAAAWGVSVSGVVQLALLVWAVKRAGMPVRLPRPRLTPRMRLLLRRMAPGLVGASATQLNQAVDVIIASLLPAGTVSLLYYADRVQQLPLGVIGTAVGTAILPLLSRQVRGGEAAAAVGTLNRAIEYALFLTLPAALALAVSAFPIMLVLFGRGAFDVESARLSAQSLTAYAVGLPAVVLLKVLAPAFFARGDTSTPVRIGMITLALNFVLNLALMVPLQHIGPPLATSLAAMFNMGALAVMLIRRGFLVPDAALRRRLPRMLIAALAMAVTLWFTEDPLFEAIAGARGLRVVALAVLVGVGSGVYLLAAQLLGAIDLRDILALLRRRRLRRGGGSSISPAPSPET
ncbi:MAG: murein biosynthesis integral membrane protein MurJ [Rhodospirillales bacterium 69-11]|nr:murein biosynthesis integral membrane protein MurJ [Rhodospirillales bacterium]OJW25744.1 MAG: murein biosynthesis integral membrane protein MurJ [Rhodospirillales bacterium 69-11]